MRELRDIQKSDPVERITELSDSFPILMFPLRLETRFKSIGNLHQLWVRVFPDDCNVNHKEELLSESELGNARSFWVEIWKAGGVESEEKGAWRSLVSSHGAGRSGWIVEHYVPVNAKPVKTNPANKILVAIASTAFTDLELKAARDYWAAVWLAKSNVALITQAGNLLRTAVGDAKAREIQEKFVPENITEEVPPALTNAQVQLAKIEFPADSSQAISLTSWTKAPKAIALPDRFVALAYNGSGKKTFLFDQKVSDNLSVGPDPSLPAEKQIKKDEAGELIVNDDLQWMVDFDKAIAAGMGIKINLTADEANKGFDKLFVVGIRFSTDQDESQALLENLITDHFNSKNGFELLKQGTPTNNTEDEPSGASSTDDPDESYERIFRKASDFKDIDDFTGKSDGQKMADSLGINPEILKKVPHANGSDQLEANAMNVALFPATLGYFLEEMMTPLFSEDYINRTKTFFSDYVSGRGPIPAIRIGKQPYGILPVTAYSRLKFAPIQPGTVIAPIKNTQAIFLNKLRDLLLQMDASWASLVPGVARIGNNNANPQQTLLDVIGLHPNSVEFHQRYSQSAKHLYNQLILQKDLAFADTVELALDEIGKTISSIIDKDNRFNIGKLPISKKYFLGEANLLSGPLVDDLPNSESSPIRPYTADGKKNYIQWLSTADAETIRTQNFGGSAAPNAILYLLLKHALMQAQADAAARLIITKDPSRGKSEFFDPDFIHVQKADGGKSKFEHLYSADSGITGNANLKLAEYIYKPEILDKTAETKRLKQTIDALKILAETPTARLERLLIEHLDCCNYRIDAWKTGLANYRLTEQRKLGQPDKKPSKGIYLGAYGWLMDVKPAAKVLANVALSPELNRVLNKGAGTPMQTDSQNLGYIHAPSLNQAAAAAVLRSAYESNKNAGAANPFAVNLTSDRVRVANNFLEGIRNGQSLSALLGYQFERGLHDRGGNIELDVYIYPLRKAFPLVADNLKDTLTLPMESIATIQANHVVDGLKLINQIKKSGVKTFPFGLPPFAGLTNASPQAIAINAEVLRILDINDAIADLVVAEQAYQMVQGNFEKASGVADAFSKGSYPPEIDIVQTPRSGVTLTQKMAIQFDTSANPAVSPSSVVMTPKAKAEPSVNQWLASMFPAPENVLCWVDYTRPGLASTPVTVSQKDLGLQSIDLLYTFNLDAEQFMTELDDRISNFIRYTVSKHPKTDVKINYTKPIDPVDKTKVSFFELAALVKSLRKIIIGNKSLNQSTFLLPGSGQQVLPVMDAAQLRNRVSILKTGLEPIKSVLEGLLNLKSIAGITSIFKGTLLTQISDVAKVEALLAQFDTDLRDYLAGPTAENKERITKLFVESISALSEPVTNSLKNDYAAKLVEYSNDFVKMDELVSQTSTAFFQLAFYDNTQTGTGFMHQAISAIYDNVFKKLDIVLGRWNGKNTDYSALIATFNPAGLPEEQFDILRRAERTISAQTTFPLPTTLAAYKGIIDGKKSQFTAALNKLNAIKINARETITAFITDVENAINGIAVHDVISFDTVQGRNDMKAEKLMLASLKEDIKVAIENAKKSVTDKIKAATDLIQKADSISINLDQITALQSAARKILGEEALILPHFRLSDKQANEFEKSFTASNALLDFVKDHEKRIFPVEDWLAGVSRVREKVNVWENISFLSNAFRPENTLDVIPLQFPFQDDDRWVALKFRDEKDPNDKFAINNDKLLYTTHFAAPFDKTKTQCGIVIDEWTEVVPSSEQNTGIAFHYDQPNSEPPQTMLLVTPPEFTKNWKWDDLITAMEETLEMAKKRAVEPAMLEKTSYAQFLPTTMMAVTLHWITVSTNLAINNNVYQRIENN